VLEEISSKLRKGIFKKSILWGAFLPLTLLN